MKKILRDTQTSLLMIIVTALLLFQSFNMSDFIQKMHIENESINSNEYSYELTCFFSDEYTSDDWNIVCDNIVDYVQNINDANVVMENLHIFFKNNVIPVECRVLINNYFNDTKRSSVILGETIYKEVCDDGKIYANGVLFSDVKTVQNNSATGIDDSITFFYTNCNDEQRVLITNLLKDSSMLFINISSSKECIYVVDELANYIENCGLQTDVSNSSFHNPEQTIWYKIYTEIFLIVSIIFSLVALFLVTDLWLSNRKSEIVIRKAFGYNFKKLFIYFFSEYLKLIPFSILFASMIQLIYCTAFRLDFKGFQNPLTFAVVFVSFVILSGLIMTFRSIVLSNNYVIAKELRGK